MATAKSMVARLLQQTKRVVHGGLARGGRQVNDAIDLPFAVNAAAAVVAVASEK